MKYIFFLSISILFSCTKVYREVWTIERFPNQWEEEIIINGSHDHYKECDNWKCSYYEADTICWQHYDTIIVRTLEKRERIK